MRWILPINREVEVPQAVAEVLANRRKTEMETMERQEAGAKLMDNDELTKTTLEISRKYNTNSALPYQE